MAGVQIVQAEMNFLHLPAHGATTLVRVCSCVRCEPSCLCSTCAPRGEPLAAANAHPF